MLRGSLSARIASRQYLHLQPIARAVWVPWSSPASAGEEARYRRRFDKRASPEPDSSQQGLAAEPEQQLLPLPACDVFQVLRRVSETQQAVAEVARRER